jgi:hypothetical protein
MFWLGADEVDVVAEADELVVGAADVGAGVGAAELGV